MPNDREAERDRKLFIGGLDYETNDGKLKDYFEQFGELTDFVVMKFPDTRRSRGFGFVTYRDPEMLEECMSSGPHTLDGKTVELKRAAPRDDDRRGGGRGGRYSGGGRGGRYDDEEIDPESKSMRKLHVIKTRRLEVKKALSKQEMGMLRKSNDRNDVWGGNNMGMGMGGGGRGGRGDDMRGGRGMGGGGGIMGNNMGGNMGNNMGGNMGSHERYLKKNAATQERRRARIRAEGYKCKVEGCGEAFMTVALLRRHNNNHNEELRKRMKCNKAKCGAKFDNRTDYDKHLDKHKEEDKAKVINMIRSVLLYNKHGLLMKSFKREFRSVTGMKVPHEMMGFSSLNDLLTNLPDVVQVTNLPEGHILLLAVPDKATEHIAKLVANQITNRKEFNFRTWEVLGKLSSDTIRMIEECVESNIRRVPESKSMRKLFIGGLNYQTTEEELRAHFEQFGEIVDCAVMKFNDTGRSRGFGFVTYDKASQLDDCQAARPHDLGGKTLETKRATPRADAGKPEAQASVRKIFIGGVTDEMEDDDIRDHFEQYGKVTNIEQYRQEERIRIRRV